MVCTPIVTKDTNPTLIGSDAILCAGMNFVLFLGCVTTLTIRRRTPTVNKLLLSIAVAMFTFSTAHVSLGFQRLIEGFITRRDRPGGPGAFFSDVSIPGNVVKVCIHTVNVRTDPVAAGNIFLTLIDTPYPV